MARCRVCCGIFLIVASMPCFLKMPACAASVSGANPVQPLMPMLTFASCAVAPVVASASMASIAVRFMVDLPFSMCKDVTRTLPESTMNRAVTEAALLRHERYVREFVEGFNFCPYARRSRDSTVQLVRASVLEKVRASGATPSVSDRIATANLKTLQGEGVDAMRALLGAIRADR